MCNRSVALSSWLLLAAIAGCAGPPVRAPDFSMRLDDGITRDFYVQSLYDMQTVAVDRDGAGRVLGQVRVLTDERLAKIETGMPAGKVLESIGPPYRRVAFENLHQTAWDYRYRDTWGYPVEFSVMIDANDRVASRISRRLEWDRSDR